MTLLSVLALLGCALSARGGGGDRVTGRAFATRSEVLARHGMAATSQPLATQAAVAVLRAGGSAVDAAIAANAVLAVVEPTGAGIGGDLFAFVWDPREGRLHGLNASGRSPGGLARAHFEHRGLTAIPSYGPLSVSVPGCVDGWFELHARFGRLPMAEVLGPAIEYAEEGFPVSQVIAWTWARAAEPLQAQPGFAETFLPGGQAPAAGALFCNPMLARTLRRLVGGGRAAFYGGSLAAGIDAFCRAQGCFLRASDLAAHRSTWVAPLATTYRGYEVWQLPPNGQGLAVLQMLNLLEPFDLARLGHNSVEALHRLIEVKKLAYEDRARYYADPDFAPLPVDGLLSRQYAKRRHARLDPARAAREVDAGDPVLCEGDTVCLSVADDRRMMVSLIQSNFRGFGSGLCPSGTGFSLQNRGELFALEADHPNVYAPCKRPFHTIIPGFVTRAGKPWLSFGVMGGDMQPQGHVQVLLNLIDFEMNLQEAGDAARFHHTGSSTPTGVRMRDGGVVHLESGIGAEVRSGLADRGHALANAVGPFGGYQAVLYDSERDVYVGASESRKDGQAAGY